MKRSIAALAAVMVTGVAHAAAPKWEWASKDGDLNTYVDVANVHTVDSKPRLWSLISSPTRGSLLTLHEADCSGRQLAALQSQSFSGEMAKGELKRTWGREAPVYPAPGTLNETVLRLLCNF